jgi:predicted hotdog family 3-hydroxylacyl-ACP dehydratase
MSEMDLPSSVAELVPHRGAMSWLDRIVSVDAERVVAEADIREASLFLRGGQLDVWIGIEYMAQAIAAWAGHRARREGRSVTLGFLVGTRRYDVHRQSFKLGERLRIEAYCELMADNGLGMFACRILVGGELAASANLSVFEPPEGEAFLNLKTENKGETS